MRRADDPVAAVERMAALRPAVAEHLDGRGWEQPVEAAYAEPFARLRPHLGALPRAAAARRLADQQPLLHGRRRQPGSSTSTRPTAGRGVLDLAVAVERNCFFWNRISAGDDGAFDLRQAEC